MGAYREGMLVENTGCPQWGPGKIVYISGDNMHVIFRDCEEDMAKLLRTDFPALHPTAAQSDDVLDNLPPLVEKQGRWVLPAKRYTLESLKRIFLHEFPAGFADPKYHNQERTYKLDAHLKFDQALGLKQMRELLAAGKVTELAAKAVKVATSINLMAVFEKSAFKDAMKDEPAAKVFFTELMNVLDATTATQECFARYIAAIDSLPSERHPVANWPVATLFLYLAAPDRHMFLKPNVTKSAADCLGFDLRYHATPNWTTYEALLRMGSIYLEKLRPMGARDFIDVQSFIYVSCGGYESAREKKKAKAAVQE